jgi:uncharacterized membrane protein
MRIRLPSVLCGWLLLMGISLGSMAGARARASETGTSAPERASASGLDFAKDVLPIFEEKCLRCHGAKRRGGQLDMRTLEAMLEGGVTGPAIQKGNSRKSLLIELVHYKEMPPKKETPRVTASELELLRRWIDTMAAPPGKPANTITPRDGPRGKSAL